MTSFYKINIVLLLFYQLFHIVGSFNHPTNQQVTANAPVNQVVKIRGNDNIVVQLANASNNIDLKSANLTQKSSDTSNNQTGPENSESSRNNPNILASAKINQEVHIIGNNNTVIQSSNSTNNILLIKDVKCKKRLRKKK